MDKTLLVMFMRQFARVLFPSSSKSLSTLHFYDLLFETENEHFLFTKNKSKANERERKRGSMCVFALEPHSEKLTDRMPSIGDESACSSPVVLLVQEKDNRDRNTYKTVPRHQTRELSQQTLLEGEKDRISERKKLPSKRYWHGFVFYF